MRVVVVTPPAPVLTVDQAKKQIGVDLNDDDALITAMIAAATQSIDGPDGWLGRAIGVQTLEARFDTVETCCAGVALPYPPHVDLVSITWLDRDRQQVVGNLEDYELVGSTVYPIGGTPTWSGFYVGREALRIRYRAGYDVVPEPILAALKIMISDLYDNRGSSDLPVSPIIDRLLNPFRVYC